MTRARVASPRLRTLLPAVLLAAAGVTAVAVPPAGAATAVGAAAAAAPGHGTLVSETPKLGTPHVRAVPDDGLDEKVNAIHDAGDKIIVGGPFTQVRDEGSSTDIARAYLFAFDDATGAVDTAFAPAVDGEITAIVGGPTPGTVYVAGRFATVNGVAREKVALLNVADGSLVTEFQGPTTLNGVIADIQLTGSRLLIGGNFTAAGPGYPRNGLASLNAYTGAVDNYLTTPLTVNHNWYTGSTGARAPVGAEKLAVSPDGARLVVIGNFKKAGGQTHDQVVKFDLGATAATIANWNTDRYVPACSRGSFDSYVRDVAFSPDGSYFVIATTGAPYSGTLCDTASRWESAATGSAQQPTWSAYSGGDTFLSTAISEQAVYVGGHFRWLNNNLATNSAMAGAIARPSIAALDPASGTPLTWNPGRNPRGYGTTEMYVTPQGLWIGYDQEWIGNQAYKRQRLAFFPIEGGQATHATTTQALPGTVYTMGQNPPSAVLYRVNAGGTKVTAADGGPDWAADTQAAQSGYHNAGTGSNTGRPTIPAVQSPVPATTPREIFSSERFGVNATPNVNWRFPVAKGTAIQVRLYFANRCACAVGSRRFHIDIDGVRKASNFDITSAVGNQVGGMRAYDVTSDGTVNIDLIRVGSSALLNAVEIVRAVAPAATGLENQVHARTYDGNAGAAPRAERSLPGPWSSARGGFWVGGTLFYGTPEGLYRMPFDGTTAGTASLVNPYSDPAWDTVPTNSGPAGQTYLGAAPDFYAELASVTGMFYRKGRIYYTIAGYPTLFWRGFNPDSGAVGAQRNTVTSPLNLAGSGGVFISGTGKLYMVSPATGNLIRMDFVNDVPGGTPTVVSGPAIDGQNWRSKIAFVGP